jgi:drug/metabolite transporter (DMT)-like permease
MKKSASGRFVVHLILGLSTAVWAGAVVVAKNTLNEVPPLTLSALRFVVATGAIGIILLLRRGRDRLAMASRDVPRVVLMGVLGITLQYSLCYIGLQYITATNAALIFGTSPAFTAILSALFLGEKLDRRRALGFVVAFIGLFLVVTEGSWKQLQLTNQRLGDLMILVIALAWAGYSVVGKPLFSHNPYLVVTFHVTWIGTLGLIPLAVWERRQLGVSCLSPSAWLAVVYMGVLCSAVAFLAWNWALSRIEASQVGVYVYIEPVVTVLLASVFLGEALIWPVVIGGGLVLGGIAVVARY